MNIKRAKDEIKNTIEAYLARDEHGNTIIPVMRQRPVLLMGPPGIGKTQIMAQIARECGIGLVAYTITHHTRQSAIGLPYIVKKEYGGKEQSVTEYTMSEIVASVYDRIEETGRKEGILFIDEINCVSETLAPTMLQFLQYKTFGNHRVPQGWIIVCAGNPPEYNKSVREFDMATLDRVKKIEVEADFEVWKEYAYGNHVHPAVIAYLNAKPAHFYRLETTVEGRIFATPRGWEDLSTLVWIYEKLGKTVDREVTVQYLQHPKIAKDFANYLELYYKYQTDYRVDEILAGTFDEHTLRQISLAPFDEKLSVISLLLSRLSVGFSAALRKEDLLTLVFERITPWKEALVGNGDGEKRVSRAEAGEELPGVDGETAHLPWESLLAEASVLSGVREEKRRAELITREEDYLLGDAILFLESQANALQAQRITEPEDAIARVREAFGKEQDEFDERTADALQKLEHAFDFMEAAFGDSQEMVIFLTECNTNRFSVRFLKENECERYYEYNRRLLFKDREEAIRRKLRGEM